MPILEIAVSLAPRTFERSGKVFTGEITSVPRPAVQPLEVCRLRCKRTVDSLERRVQTFLQQRDMFTRNGDDDTPTFGLNQSH